MAREVEGMSEESAATSQGGEGIRKLQVPNRIDPITFEHPPAQSEEKTFSCCHWAI